MGGGAQSPSLSDPASCSTVRVSGEARWVWRLEYRDTGASWVGPADWGGLPGGRNRDTEGRNGAVRVSGQVSLSGEKRPEWGPGGPRAERRGGVGLAAGEGARCEAWGRPGPHLLEGPALGHPLGAEVQQRLGAAATGPGPRLVPRGAAPAALGRRGLHPAGPAGRRGPFKTLHNNEAVSAAAASSAEAPPPPPYLSLTIGCLCRPAS